MDPKAIAKSKRSHTQHGRKSHPPPASVAAQKKKKKAAEAGEEERVQRALPSNWDRYGDDNDGDGVDSKDGAENSNVSGEEVVAKSNGADFSYLIEQAKSNPQEFKERAHRDSFDDLSFDFVRGVSSMLSVRGESLLSWCQDDKFIVDDETVSEVPLLSMDLHALAAQLSKLKLSQRLFIEPELIPEELCVDDTIRSSFVDQTERSEATETRSGSDSSPFLGFPASENNSNNLKDSHGSICTDGDVIPQGLEGETYRPQTSLLATNLEPSKSSEPPDGSGRREYRESVSQGRNEVMPHVEQAKISGFTDSEAELDMLLNSFSEIKTSESVTDSLTRTPISLAFGPSAPVASQAIKQIAGSFGNISITGLDDSIDDLLSETSIHIKDTKQPGSQKEAISSVALPHHPLGSEPMVASTSSRYVATTSLDDLLEETSVQIQGTKQAWSQKEVVSSTGLPHRPLGSGSMVASTSSSYGATTSLDDSIDDLLAETSVDLTERKRPTYPKEDISNFSAPPSSSLGSKAVDGFDSWFDTV